MFTSIGNIVGPILGGALFDKNINYPYYFAAIVMIVGILITIYWKKSSNSHSSHIVMKPNLNEQGCFCKICC